MALSHAAGCVSRVDAVPAAEWQTFLGEFSRRHRAWLATIHGVERGVPVTCIPSAGLASVTLNGHDPDHIVCLTFLNGASLSAPRPRAVRVQSAEDGAECALEVETVDDGFLRLAFRATALPEQVDGLAPAEVMVRRPI